MEDRDERAELRHRLDEIEKGMADATARAGRMEQEIAALKAAARDQDTELRRLKLAAAPSAATSMAPYLTVGSLVVAGSIAAYAMLGARGAAPAPAPTQEATAIATAAPSVPPPIVPSLGDGPGSGGIVPPNERLQWGIGAFPSVFPVHIDNDGVEDFVGLYRLFDGGHTLYVGGFDGATFVRKWLAGPFGTLTEGILSTHAALSGKRVLVTDFRSRGHILETGTGKEVQTLTFTDRARRLCALPTGDVWVEIEDGKHVTVNLAMGTQTPAGAAPPSCVADFARPICAFTRAPCAASTGDAPGVRGLWTLGSGNGLVTVGMKTPGTPTSMAFAAGGKGWTATVAQDPAAEAANPFDTLGADIAGGLFVSAYAVTEKGIRLVALDVETGARRWDVAIPRSTGGSPPHGLTATETRVYVPHWTWLDIFELKTGKVLGTVGMW